MILIRSFLGTIPTTWAMRRRPSKPSPLDEERDWEGEVRSRACRPSDRSIGHAVGMGQIIQTRRFWGSRVGRPIPQWITSSSLSEYIIWLWLQVLLVSFHFAQNTGGPLVLDSIGDQHGDGMHLATNSNWMAGWSVLISGVALQVWKFGTRCVSKHYYI